MALLLAFLLLARSAAAAPQDEAATKLGKEGMEGDYLAMRFKQAEQKLKNALFMCGKKNCSGKVRARLHTDLAVIYIAGQKKKDKGKKELKNALDADPSVQLNPDFATPELEKAFADAGGVAEEPETEEESDAEEEAHDEAERRAAAEAAMSRNWFSPSFQQEFLLHEALKGVCIDKAQYECFRGNVSYSGTIFPAAGNELSTGVGLATRRVLLGYERLLLGRITAGGKLGFAFGGRPNATNPTFSIQPGFMPLHVELRGSYWFGQAPFQRKGLRPFAGLAAGIGEVNGKATVYVYRNEAEQLEGRFLEVDAWRKADGLFASLHGGAAYAFHQHHQLVLELRVLRLFGLSANVAAASLGYSLGF
jgi:hypothetical protein